VPFGLVEAWYADGQACHKAAGFAPQAAWRRREHEEKRAEWYVYHSAIAFLLQTCILLLYVYRMKRVTLFLTEQQIAVIQEMAATTGLKFAEILRRLIDEGLHAQQMRGKEPATHAITETR
jgi:hypothetical protein